MTMGLLGTKTQTLGKLLVLRQRGHYLFLKLIPTSLSLFPLPASKKNKYIFLKKKEKGKYFPSKLINLLSSL